MPKPQDIFQLARQEAVRVTASPQAWQSFLYTAAHNYHTTYLNQLLIHAQRPDAAACASMEYWNTKANRLVMRGSRSITVLQRRQGVAVTKPVFAIGDTTLLSQTSTGGPWEVTDTTRPLLLQGKSDDWLAALAQDGVSNEADRARRMLERNVADSTLQWAQPDEQMQLLQALVTQSAVYMARLRIGLPVRDEDFPAFQSVSQFDTYQISLCLGGYVQAASKPMLDTIGRKVLRLNRDSIAISHEPVHNESTRTQLNSREEAVTYDVHEEPRRLPDSEPFPAEPAEPLPEPLREAVSGISGTERADALRPADAGGHAADELQSNWTDSTADGGQDPARADADHTDAGPQDEPAGLGTDDQQPEKAGGGSSPSDAVRSLTEIPAQAESEQALSAFALPEFPPTLLPQLLAAETSSRAYNAEYLTFYNKNPLLIDRLRFVRESYKDIFTELLLADDTRVGFHRQDNGLLVWQGAYLTRSAETLLSWRAVANALNDLIEQHELIAAIDPKELPQVEEQLSFELPDGSPPITEDDRFEKDDFLTPEKQENVIRSALPVAEYNAPQMDDGSVITDEEVNLALAAGSNFENSKFRIYQQFTTTQGDHAAFLKKEYGSGGRSWDYQSGAHGWVDHGPAGLKLILTNEEGRFERRLLWRAAAKRIAYLIEMQRFLTPQELEQYPAWAAEQQEAASAVRDEPGNVPDTRPICAEGSVVYLEDDHRFTVERIGQFDVHLRDEEVPLFGRAISREEFQRQLDTNPRNGGMMLSEQQHEALVQAQTEQALSYIEDYLKDEFEITEPDFSDLTRIDLGYTTTEDEKHVIQVYADLEHCTVTKLVDDTLYAQERYGSLDDLNQAVLSNLNFDSLMEIDLDEAEEHEPQENALPTDESAAQALTNYLAPYEPEMYMDELTDGHGIVFATGTPISNSMTEMYIMMRYLQYGLLEQEGLLNFDAWASTFGESVTAIELAPEGNGYRSKTRFAKFYNLPELMNMFKQCADIQTADMLKLPVPEITGGKPTIVKLPPSELQRQMVAALGERAEAVRNHLVAPNEDNMLRITNDGRKLALDQRLMNPLLPDDPDSKANACVERVFTIWERTKAQHSTQMIFCDLSTPRADGFDVYNDIRDKLVARGIPKDEVQFIHDADTEAKKAELFGKVRSGAVRVLMGSTQKMGAGTNVQTRLCALHHLDCPWRPADIAQRNGRMVRQGNMNKEVSIFIYITEATFDAYSYQLVENKQKFISQIMTSKSPARSCEDLDEAALSYAEVKALAAGNPMIKEKMDLDIQVARLRTLKAAYNSQHYRLEDAVTGIFLREIRGTECRIQAFEKDMQTAKDSQSYDKDGKLVFSIELDGTSYDKREDAGKALLGLVGAAVRADHHVLVGHYAGFEVTVAYVPLSKVFVAHLVGQATHTTELGSDAAGNMVRLQNVVAALPQEVSGLRNNLQQLRVQLDSAKEELQQPFLQEQELNDKSARLAELDALLNVGNDAPVLEGEAEVVNEDDSVRTPREENELER